MQRLSLTIRLVSQFSTPLKGDTLFGQLCWILRERLGDSGLTDLLDGYTTQRPFAVISDAIPKEAIPKPCLPLHCFGFDKQVTTTRKRFKKSLWLRSQLLDTPVPHWGSSLIDDLNSAPFSAYQVEHSAQPHNSINRMTMTTGEGDFAPYSVQRMQVPAHAQWLLHILFDPARIDSTLLIDAVTQMGLEGFGKDASIGKGRFVVESSNICTPDTPSSTSWLTLAPADLRHDNALADKTFYQTLTRFGKHGRTAVLSGKPFKNPILLADSGAVVTLPDNEPKLFIGNGLGGNGELSQHISATVHQGYSPVLPISLG